MDTTKIQLSFVTPVVPSLTYKEFKKLEISYCDSFTYEINDLYLDTDSIGYGGDEVLVLDDKMKEVGFEVVDGGWGNWQKGPRMVHLTLKRGNCECTITKKYTTIQTVDGIITKMKVTEEISCNVTK